MGTRRWLSRLQKRGQVTIPIAIRRRLGLEQGDMLAFVETGEGILIRPQTLDSTEPRTQAAAYRPEPDAALRELFEFSDRLATGEYQEGGQATPGIAKRTAGIFQRPGQKPADFQAQRRSFVEGTARNAQAATGRGSSTTEK